jgi:ABC-type multidrug transport system fused ATPase/permease subunit
MEKGTRRPHRHRSASGRQPSARRLRQPHTRTRSHRRPRSGAANLLSALRGIANLYKLVWEYARGHRIRYTVGLTLQAAGFLCTLTPPLLLGLAVDAAQRSKGQDLASIVLWLALTLVSTALAWALNGPGRLLERSVSLEVHRNLVDDLVRRALHVDMRWHEPRHSGDTTHRIQATVRATVAFSESQTFLIRALITFVGATVALTAVSWPVGIAALVGFTVLGVFTIGRDRGLRDQLDSHNEAMAQLSGAVTDVLGNITTVATLGAGASVRRRVRDVLDEIVVRGRRILVPMERKWWLITYGSAALHSLLLIGYVLFDSATSGTVHVGPLVMISGYAMSMHTAFEIMGGHWQAVLMHQAEARSADELRAAPLARATDNEIPSDWRTLHVEELQLRHPPRGTSGGRTSGVTASQLPIRRGERIAVVGPSGAGKSSFLRALAGIYSSQRFAVSFDGRPVSRATSLAGAAGLIAQETEVFAGTVRANIDLGTDATEERIQAAATDAELDSLLMRLPDGLDTDLVERGVNLSGGEKQRVGLARGLLHTDQCSLLLLDEPTSSLDPVTEAVVYDNIMRSRPNTTIISAIHRLHLLDHFDTIVFMKDGTVVDVGPCDAVAQRRPEFAAMLNASATASLTPPRHLEPMVRPLSSTGAEAPTNDLAA